MIAVLKAPKGTHSPRAGTTSPHPTPNTAFVKPFNSVKPFGKFLCTLFGVGLGLSTLMGAASSAAAQTTFNYTGTIDTYTVPVGVNTIHIEARGAEGGHNTSSTTTAGLGAIMSGDFAVTPGAQLKILVGQQPTATSGNGGGGGTFVTDSSNTPLIVAGGGGGSSQSADSPDKHGQIGTNGGQGAAGGGLGGTNGSGGSIGASGFQSGAGGGLLTDGADGWTSDTGGRAFINGGAGAPTNAPANGGFGGGGSGSSYVVGGGGGGYSGGGSGGNSTAGVGGGGGSYNIGTNQVNTGGANSGNGLVIISALLPNLTVTIAPSFSDTFSEGAGSGATQVRITRDGDTTNALNIALRTSDTSEATIQSSATIAAGESIVDVPVNAVEDGLTDGTIDVMIKATAAGYASIKQTLHVTDNEVAPANLSVKLSPNAFAENKAGNATYLAVSHDRPDTSSAVVVNVSSSDARLNVPATVTIPAGSRKVEVPVTVTPNADVQGTVVDTVTVTATNFNTAAAQATIYDAEAALSLTQAPGYLYTISEGPNNTSTMLRLSRNTPTTNALVVTLAFRRGDGQVVLPTTVTIPAGETYADFTVTSVDDTVQDGTQSVALLATVTGYKAASTQVFVTDNEPI